LHTTGSSRQATLVAPLQYASRQRRPQQVLLHTAQLLEYCALEPHGKAQLRW
jgi:hypothetical protein